MRAGSQSSLSIGFQAGLVQHRDLVNFSFPLPGMMTVPDCNPSVRATIQGRIEDGRRQDRGTKPAKGYNRGATQDLPTLSRRSLLLRAASLIALYWATAPGPVVALGLPKATVQEMKDEARQDVKAVLGQLDRDLSGVANQVVATDGGSALGFLGSLSVLSSWGSVVGLSASGITSGLAAAGALVVGSMTAGIGVLAAPVWQVGLVLMPSLLR